MPPQMQQIIQKMVQSNPRIANNPMFQAIQSGDSQKGEEIANNLCKSYGVTKDQAVAQAKQFFGIK